MTLVQDTLIWEAAIFFYDEDSSDILVDYGTNNDIDINDSRQSDCRESKFAYWKPAAIKTFKLTYFKKYVHGVVVLSSSNKKNIW